MDNHQALVASPWDADQVALRDLVDGISRKIIMETSTAFRAGAANIIQAELEARKGDDHCSLSSFLATIYEKLWLASYCPFRRHGAFQEANPHHTHRPVVPLLFTTDMNAIAEKGKEKCLVQVLCEFVTNNYLEPKYVPGALLNEIASPQKSLPDVLSLQEEFWRQLQQKSAVAEETSEESAMEVTVAGTEKDETHDDTDESDSEFGDVKTSLKGKPWGSQQENVCRAKVLFSKLKITDFASEDERNWDNGTSALDVLQDVLRADYNAYQNFRHFIIGYRETKDRKWYCARTIALAPYRIRGVDIPDDTSCCTCATSPAGRLCLRLKASGRGKGEKMLDYTAFFAFEFLRSLRQSTRRR